MIPTHAQLICVLFLCGLEETVLCQHGHCTGNQCFAVFQEQEDFPGAQKSCNDNGGQLLNYSSEQVKKILNSLLKGSYWIDLHSTDRSGKCPSISVSTGRDFTVLWEPCRGRLDGFLCQYTIDQPCSGLQAGAGTQVKYTYMDFKVDDLEMFPQGTIAVAGKAGAKYPDSKHLCFSSNWMAAPWNCEVMQGGCEHECNSTTCTCPVGKTLNPNKINCSEGPCDDNPCTGEGEECENTQAGHECICKDGFMEENGACVNVTICEKCEHLLCDPIDGVYTCGCQKGFKVAANEPTKCELICYERDCPAICITDRDKYQCFCPDGYIKDIQDTKNSTPFCTDINECETKQCDHKCENLFGGHKCLCDEGFKLNRDEYTCDPVQKDEEDGSGSTLPLPTPAGAHPAALPSYIKTGSVLGITMFLALCAALLCCFIRNLFKRCGKFKLSSLKHSDIDIFYLQQVTTETYKRLSFDKQLKNDS
ncbi:thrombomodulin-like [Cottoperca gobio]|uniref:Thrombomodulin n=1 Tax=Cottoperca gobio TaxID=56716 RepID=A0A6J2S7J3_COTGO|nr:thrombomodulin-like [Cottoperca gobio]